MAFLCLERLYLIGGIVKCEAVAIMTSAGNWQIVCVGVLLMPVSRNARRIKVMLAVVGAIGLASVAAYICRLKSAPAPQMPSPPVQTPGQSADQTDGEEFLLSEQVPLGSLLGSNSPALPPIIMALGPPPGEGDTPDLSTPAVALHSVLSLIDQAATDELTLCFIEEAGDTASDLYPRYLGHPVELVDVVE